MVSPDYRQSAVHVYVPTFTLHEEHLAIITTATVDRHSLPNIYMRKDHFERTDPFHAAASEALYTAFGEAQPTLEPIITYTKNESGGADIELGYAALTSLIDISANPTLDAIPLPQIEDSPSGLTNIEIDFVKSGLEAFRPYSHLSWGIRLQEPETLLRLSRLVKNPRRFTVTELRLAYQALLYDSVGSGDYSQAPEEQIEPTNFQRACRSLPLVSLPGQHHQGEKGRPASLWAMPPDILNARHYE